MKGFKEYLEEGIGTELPIRSEIRRLADEWGVALTDEAVSEIVDTLNSDEELKNITIRAIDFPDNPKAARDYEYYVQPVIRKIIEKHSPDAEA